VNCVYMLASMHTVHLLLHSATELLHEAESYKIITDINTDSSSRKI